MKMNFIAKITLNTAQSNMKAFRAINKHYNLVHTRDGKIFCKIFTTKPFGPKDSFSYISSGGIERKCVLPQFLIHQSHEINPETTEFERTQEADNYYSFHKEILDNIVNRT